MIATVASYKGGVGKTTTAIQLAAYLQTLAPTLLLDGDSTRSATKWAEQRAEARGPFPFRVAPVQHAAMLAHKFAHLVIDTGQKPSDEELKALVDGCDLLILPAVPYYLDADGLGQTIGALQMMQGANYRVLLTKVPAYKAGAAAVMRQQLAEAGVPMFSAEIPRLDAFDKAASNGLIVYEVKDANAARAWSCYEAVGREIEL